MFSHRWMKHSKYSACVCNLVEVCSCGSASIRLSSHSVFHSLIVSTERLSVSFCHPSIRSECHTNLPEYGNKLKNDTDQDFVSFAALSKGRMSHVCHELADVANVCHGPVTPNYKLTAQQTKYVAAQIFTMLKCVFHKQVFGFSGSHSFSHCSSFHSSCQLTTTAQSISHLMMMSRD